MNVSTLFKFLIGNRQAILDIAASRTSVYVGLLFVLAAGLAREYDGEDLRSEPWHLLLPLGASLVTSALLYVLLKALLWLRGGEADGRKLSYRELLSLYWMTAPLALLYGIPVERFLSAGDATRANLTLLGIVSLWRVLVMTRALSVVYQVSFFRALFPLMLFADSVALALLSISPRPIMSIMGGIRLSESEQVLHNVSFTVNVLGFLSLPIWLIGALIAVCSKWHLAGVRDSPSHRTSRFVWIAAVSSILIWFFPLPFTQSEQSLRHQVETDFRTGRVHEALEVMSAHDRGDFPPHWDPPPRIGYREKTPDIIEVAAQLDVTPLNGWVRQVYADKFQNSLRGEEEGPGIWWELSPDQVKQRIEIIERMPNKAELIQENVHGLENIARSMPSPLKERIRKLVEEARRDPPE
jgi:hypothetical protein